MIVIGNNIAIAVIAPIAEEVFFRGALWARLEAEGKQPLLFCSVIWIVPHGIDGIAKMIYLIPNAIAFGLLRRLSSGVGFSIALHIAANLIAFNEVALAVHFGLRP
jgi:membrane protease YdiL (CAAX protease family)